MDYVAKMVPIMILMNLSIWRALSILHGPYVLKVAMLAAGTGTTMPTLFLLT